MLVLFGNLKQYVHDSRVKKSEDVSKDISTQIKLTRHY